MLESPGKYDLMICARRLSLHVIVDNFADSLAVRASAALLCIIGLHGVIYVSKDKIVVSFESRTNAYDYRVAPKNRTLYSCPYLC